MWFSSGGISQSISNVMRFSSVNLGKRSQDEEGRRSVTRDLRSASWVWREFPKWESRDRGEGTTCSWWVWAVCRAKRQQKGEQTDRDNEEGSGAWGRWLGWKRENRKEHRKYSRKRIDNTTKEASVRVGSIVRQSPECISFSNKLLPSGCQTVDRFNKIRCQGYLFLNRSLFPDKAKVLEKYRILWW